MRWTGIWKRGSMALPFVLSACESDLSNAVFDADETFLEAVPRREQLRLAPETATPESPRPDEVSAQGGMESASLALGPETAELYRLTRAVTWSIDHQIFGTLRAVEDLVSRPPTTRTAETRIWGPYREALSPFEVRFVMARDADARVTYAFEQRTPGGEFRIAVGGSFRPDDADGQDADGQDTAGRDTAGKDTAGEDTAEQAVESRTGQGEIHFDLSAFGGQGQVDVQFERHLGGVDFTLDLSAVTEGATATDPGDARYAAHRGEDGSGALTFVALREDGQRWDLKSRWRADGAGRADARITTAGAAGLVTECWDTDFARTYASGDLETGEVADCAFPERLLPDDDFSKSVFGSGTAGVSK